MGEAKRVIRLILAIYLTTTGFFLFVFFHLWYEKLYEELINTHSSQLSNTHRTIVLSISNSKYTPINQTCQDINSVSDLKFAIFDQNNTICSNLDFEFKPSEFTHAQTSIYKGKIIYIANMNSSNFYLNQEKDETKQSANNAEGVLKTFIQGDDVSKELMMIRSKVLICLFVSFLCIALISYFLVKVALKPLENKIKTLNNFIKDFTHEINTPLSVILLSIERLEQKKEFDETKLTRMKIAAKTLAQTYSDLIFYAFADTISNEEERLDIAKLVEERLEYFKLLLEQKKLKLSLNLEQNVFIFASKNKIGKMLDNLISNAIKYNKKGGSIDIYLQANQLSIKDSGCGIEKDKLEKIFKRYTRFNKDQGGFGIGLSLVKSICKEYKIKITCHSKLGEGSEFVLEW